VVSIVHLQGVPMNPLASLLWLLSPLPLAWLITIRVAISAPADQCDSRLHPISGQAGYIWRGDRCEGFYVSPSAATDVELVSLLWGKLHFMLQPNAHLKVTAPNIAPHVQGPVRVRAVALPLRTYYRMDAVLPTDRPLLWPVDAVLFPWRLEANRIGVFGWVGTEAEKTFVPLQVVQPGAPEPQGPVEMIVRLPVDVEIMKWRSSIESDELSSPSKWFDAATTPVPAGRPVTIVVPDGPVAVLHMEIAAKERHRDRWSTLSIRMIRLALP